MTTQPCQCPFICGEHPKGEPDARVVHFVPGPESVFMACGIAIAPGVLRWWTTDKAGVTCPACLTAMGDLPVVSGTDAVAAPPEPAMPKMTMRDALNAFEVIRDFTRVGEAVHGIATLAVQRIRADGVDGASVPKPEPGSLWTSHADPGSVDVKVNQDVTAEQVREAVAAVQPRAAAFSGAPLPPARSSRVEVGPVKPTAVAVGQRWRNRGDVYEVTEGPEASDLGDWWKVRGEGVHGWRLGVHILADEYLGLAATEATR